MKKNSAKNIIRNVNKGGQLICELVVNIDQVLFIRDCAKDPWNPTSRIYEIYFNNDIKLNCSKEEYENLKQLLNRRR